MPDKNTAPYHAQLQTSPWFAALPAAMQAELLAAAQLLSLSAGQTLFRRGDPPCGLYAVLSGALSAGAVDEQGKEALLTVIEPTTWFGEISVFDGLPRTHDTRALTDSLLLHIPQPALQALLHKTPAYWQQLALLMSQKLRFSFLHIEANSLLPAPARLARRLLLIAEGYGGVSHGQRRIKLPQEKLAALLGLSRQTTNQLLKDMAAQGLLRLQYGEIEILDLDGLRRAAGLAEAP